MNDLISRYRAQLMAFASIAILCTHSGASFGIFMLDRLFMIGFGGVDIFFFLSGFGLSVSMSRNPSARVFYKKRFMRIMPTFWIILLGAKLVTGRFEWLPFLKLASTLGYWMPGAWGWSYFAWFVSAILLLYLLFPPYFRCLRRHPLGTTLGAITVAAITIGAYIYTFFVILPDSWNGQILFYGRIPVFALGALGGYYWATGTRLRHSWIWIVMAVVMFVIYNTLILGHNYRFLYKTSLVFIPWALIVPGWCYATAWGLNKIPAGWIHKILRIIGSSTLEAYLLINPVYHFREEFVLLIGNRNGGIFVMMAVTMVLAIIIHYLIGLIPGFNTPKKSPHSITIKTT